MKSSGPIIPGAEAQINYNKIEIKLEWLTHPEPKNRQSVPIMSPITINVDVPASLLMPPPINFNDYEPLWLSARKCLSKLFCGPDSLKEFRRATTPPTTHFR